MLTSLFTGDPVVRAVCHKGSPRQALTRYPALADIRNRSSRDSSVHQVTQTGTDSLFHPPSVHDGLEPRLFAHGATAKCCREACPPDGLPHFPWDGGPVAEPV